LLRSYEKRKAAALEIESRVRESQKKESEKEIVHIITCLRDEFIENTQGNNRKGGVFLLRGCFCLCVFTKGMLLKS